MEPYLDGHLSHFAAVLLKHMLNIVLDLGSSLLWMLLRLLLLLLLPMLLLLHQGVPNRLLLRLLVHWAVMLLLLRLPHNSLLDTLLLAWRGRPPERGHGGLRRRRLHRHRPAPALLDGHDPDRLPVGHLHHAAPWRLLDDQLLAVLQHQHPVPAGAVGRPQHLPHRLLDHDAVLLLLGMVLDVLGLLEVNSIGKFSALVLT